MSVKPTYEELERYGRQADITIENLEQKLAESHREFRAADATIENLQMQVEKMAAENAGLKQTESNLVRNIINDLGDTEFQYSGVHTPATDAFLAEVRAQARNEGINYAASRLAAAFNHGFVDKPLTEVCDVVRMILDTKEELANSTLPAADGLSGEYAEKLLEEFAAQLRKGVQS
ncbi:TPA: hypothetical protein ACH1PF_002475 [Enterobacter cloacae]